MKNSINPLSSTSLKKQQIRNLLSKLGYSCGIMNNTVIVYASLDELKSGHYEYLLSKGFVLRSDDVLGKWLEYPL